MKIIYVRISCTIFITYGLPTIQIAFIVSWRPSFPKLCWFLDVSPVSMMSCHFTFFNMISYPIRMAIWTPWLSLGWISSHTTVKTQKYLFAYFYDFIISSVRPPNTFAWLKKALTTLIVTKRPGL